MQTRAPDPTPRHLDGERGMTLVEMIIASVLFVAVVMMTYTTTIVVTKYNQRNDAQLRQETSYRRVLEKLRAELVDATTEKDPKTNLPRFSISQVNGRDQLSFQKLIGATTVNGELTPLWSTNIAISSDAKGNVVRTQDGEGVTIASGIKELRFSQVGDGFKIDCVTSWRDPKTGKHKDVSHAMQVKPLN